MGDEIDTLLSLRKVLTYGCEEILSTRKQVSNMADYRESALRSGIKELHLLVKWCRFPLKGV